MKRLAAAALALSLLAAPALAALKVGAVAPDFATTAFLAGKPSPFRLSTALKSGPVVLYFFPSAFTSGCTIEAHEFAEATPQFKALGAQVIGVTAGKVERLAEFSRSECRDAFPVAGVSQETIRAYDAVLALKPDLSDRVTYVIAPDGRIVLAYASLTDPQSHIAKAKEAVKAWRAAHP
ncbi:MAG: peroxiredoxin [Pseudomonadota bacterium]